MSKAEPKVTFDVISDDRIAVTWMLKDTDAGVVNTNVKAVLAIADLSQAQRMLSIARDLKLQVRPKALDVLQGIHVAGLAEGLVDLGTIEMADRDFAPKARTTGPRKPKAEDIDKLDPVEDKNTILAMIEALQALVA